MAPRPEPRAGWRFARLLDAPHRLAFAAGALLLAGSALWWALALLARLQGWDWRWHLPPAVAHGLLMSLGCMPLFFTGFLFTAGPRWLARPPLPARALLGPVLAQLSGWALFLLAVHGGREPALAQVLGAIGLAAVAWGWSGVLWRFVRLLRASEVADRQHARAVALGGGFGALALWAAALALFGADFALLQRLVLASLWCFSGLIFVAVLQRLLPFYSAGPGSLLAWLALFALQAAWALLAPEASALLWLRAGIEGLAGLAVLALALRWSRQQSLRPRLLAMLHLALLWLGLALLLGAVSQGLRAASAGALSLGLAPLHAYSMGFLGSTLIAMVTRVSCGHGGRAVAADDMVWRLFWLLQLAVLLRLLAALLPAAPTAPLLASAALGWAGVCLAWALRYGHWYGSPRADGRPG